MKLKNYVALIVSILFFTLVIITNNGIAEPQNNDVDPLKTLIDKIDEIINVFNMNLKLKTDEEIKGRLKGLFHKYISSAPEKFEFKEAIVNGPGNVIPDNNVDAMADHWIAKKDAIQFELLGFDYEVEEEEDLDEDKVNAKARVYIKFFWAQSPDHIGEISFELLHMKRCIWD